MTTPPNPYRLPRKLRQSGWTTVAVLIVALVALALLYRLLDSDPKPNYNDPSTLAATIQADLNRRTTDQFTQVLCVHNTDPVQRFLCIGTHESGLRDVLMVTVPADGSTWRIT